MYIFWSLFNTRLVALYLLYFVCNQGGHMRYIKAVWVAFVLKMMSDTFKWIYYRNIIASKQQETLAFAIYIQTIWSTTKMPRKCHDTKIDCWFIENIVISQNNDKVSMLVEILPPFVTSNFVSKTLLFYFITRKI